MALTGFVLNGRTSLSEAIDYFLMHRAHHLKPRSMENYRSHFRRLTDFFGSDRRLETFHDGLLSDYQGWRSSSEQGRRKVGSSAINHELSALSQILKLAGIWKGLREHYQPLPKVRWSPPKVLKGVEEERFFRFAASRPEWRRSYLASLVTANTTILGCELRSIRLQDLGLDQVIPQVRVVEITKNENRVRNIPLNGEAEKAFRGLLQLAHIDGAQDPGDYLFPFRLKRGKFDPKRPASPTFIRTAFRRIARMAGLPWLTPRSFRHQAMTKLLESGAPDETVRAIAGQASRKAMEYYSHIRMEAKSAALQKLVTDSASRAQPGRRTTGKSNLASLRGMARRLAIPEDAAIELVLAFAFRQSA